MIRLVGIMYTFPGRNHQPSYNQLEGLERREKNTNNDNNNNKDKKKQL